MTKNSFNTLIPNPILNFFTKGNQRSLKAKKNIVFSFLIKGLSIGITLVLVPLTIDYVNPTKYGIWLTLSSIIGWLGFFDIGFGNGLRNKLAEALAQRKHKLARIYISTTYAILSIIVAIILVLFFTINPFLNWAQILNTPSTMTGELSILAMTVFLFFCLQFVLQLITVVLTANQQPAKASLFNFLGSLLSLSIIFILTKTTQSNLLYLALSLGIAPICVLIGSSIWYYTHAYRKYAPSIKYVRFKFAKNLMSLGLKFFMIQIAFVVLYQTSNIIIAQVFGPEQVTSYNIAYKYFGIVPMVFSIIMMPFWSAFTEAWVKKDTEWIQNSMTKLKLFWLLLSITAIGMLVVSNFMYKLWVGDQIIVPFSVSITMAVYVVLNAWNGIYSQFLNGVGKIKLQLYSAIGGSLLNIPFSIFLCKNLGIYGVVLSTIIISLFNAFISPIQFRKLITNTAKGIWAK